MRKSCNEISLSRCQSALEVPTSSFFKVLPHNPLLILPLHRTVQRAVEYLFNISFSLSFSVFKTKVLKTSVLFVYFREVPNC